MNTFGLDKNHEQFNFEEITLEDLQIISGGSGSDRCITGVLGGAIMGGLAGFSMGGSSIGAGFGAVGGALTGASAGCFG